MNSLLKILISASFQLTFLSATFPAIAAAAGPASRSPEYQFSVVHSFNGTDGSCPMRALLATSEGIFFGTAASGGLFGGGTLFTLGSSGQFVVIHSFDPSKESKGPNGLVLGKDGKIYGSTYGDGGTDGGSVYVLSPAGIPQIIHNFTEGRGAAPLMQASDGNFYGALALGGEWGFGAVYRMTLDGETTILYSFPVSVDGVTPVGALTEGPDGALYGMTDLSGQYGFGTAYRLSKDGEYTLLHSFTGGSDGSQPFDGFTLGSDAHLHGTTAYGGNLNTGTVFRMSTAGKISQDLSFDTDSSNGRWPNAGVTPSGRGHVYGTTVAGGPNQAGEVFEAVGTRVTVLHSFTSDGLEGMLPYARLVQAKDGVLYGSACGGGSANAGTIFTLTKTAP